MGQRSIDFVPPSFNIESYLLFFQINSILFYLNTIICKFPSSDLGIQVIDKKLHACNVTNGPLPHDIPRIFARANQFVVFLTADMYYMKKLLAIRWNEMTRDEINTFF